MVDFEIPDRSIVPEVDEIDINPHRLQKIMEETENYNSYSRQSAAYDDFKTPIPERFWGRNRYRIVVSEGQDATYGPYSIVSIYELIPGMKEGLLIAKYRPTRAAYKDSKGSEIGAVPLQTVEQADRHALACRMNAEREERMARKDPKLTASVAIHMPILMAPDAARKRINARQTQG
jgi:hypothetical protein